MLASLHPNSPASDQAVRDLLDHRARASHARYTSVSFSQRSDSPSIYSRGDFSPNPAHRDHRQGGWPSHSGYPGPLSSQDQSAFDDSEDENFTSSTRGSLDLDRQSLPAADDDDDDDCISFISAPTPRPPLHPVSAPPLPESDADSPPTEELDEDPRMSMLGPKMRFVSRAPWELGEDDLQEEEDEEDPVTTADALSMFSSKMTSWRSRDQDKSSIKGLGLSTLRSRSPGPPSASSKKSGNSLYRFQTRELQKDGPYGPYLSGASQSHSAIPNTFISASRSFHSVTDSLLSDSPTRGYPRDSSEATSQGARTDTFPDVPFPTHPIRSEKASYSSHNESTISSHSDSPSSSRYIHPYANPDIIPMAGPAPSVPLPRTPSTVPDRLSEELDIHVSPLRRASESATSPPRAITLRKASAGALPLPPLPSRPTGLQDHAEEQDEEASHTVTYSRPRTSSKPVPPSPARSTVPYGDQPGSPMHNLITLDQARARASNASACSQATNNGVTSKVTPSSTLVAGLGLAPGVVVDSGIIRGQVPRSIPPLIPSSDVPQVSDNSYQRPRTMSSGKHMFGSSSGADGETAPPKTLKHKKSAFMKLFQGKDKEKEKEQFFSPAPEYPPRSMSTPPQLPPSESLVPPVPSLHNIKRIPPPLPLSVVVTSPSFPPSGSPPRPGPEKSTARPASPSRIRQASSPLPSSSHALTQTTNHGQQLASNELHSLQRLEIDHGDHGRPAVSAPPTQTSFEALSLRPVSTIFSAKFPDLLCPSPPETAPATKSSLKRLDDPFPPTPGFSYSRSNSMSTASDYPLTPTSGPLSGPPSLGLMSGEDPSSVITALQEQIVNSRKMWQRQIWELEGQVKDLKSEVDELRNAGECDTCGQAKRDRRLRIPSQNTSVVDRPRPRLGGGGTRTVFGGGNDM